MSYCKKKGIEPTVCYCLACEYCLPPAELRQQLIDKLTEIRKEKFGIE